jgi:ring-1,2-phenylacetyl-CoA epoxidase subunit PaaB
MNILSLDPRINRIQIDADTENPQAILNELENWPTYEVFHQKKRGTQHEHVGIVHAPSPELALAFAKEQFARRGETVNLWVVKSEHVMATEYADADVFATTPEKTFRDPAAYSVKDKIDQWVAKQKNHAG